MSRTAPERVDPLGNGVILDDNIMAALPRDCVVMSVEPSGHSSWVATVKIDVKLANEARRTYFKKGASGQVGYNMMKGSFEGEAALHEFIPEHVPRPIAYGSYSSRPDTYFYISEFVDMLDSIPSPRAWAGAIANLHRRSMGRSPTGMFGFQSTTHLANVPVDNTWNSSWEVLWTQQMKSLLHQEEVVRGPDPELTRLKDTFLTQVIPRYIRPLETEGRSISPCLIHSDLWPGNIKPRSHDHGVAVFDPCAYWGHNEADLAICYNPRYRLGRTYLDQYYKTSLLQPSEPRNDFEYRHAVYAMKYHVLLSIMYARDPSFRKIAMDEMRRLVNTIDTTVQDAQDAQEAHEAQEAQEAHKSQEAKEAKETQETQEAQDAGDAATVAARL
ncbi:Fructosamine kinase-domain-containing protein [Xylaria intraflava]|nr:Fructosamine kinase-domain-containing protein [Xylaria intraflava]